MNRIHVLTVVPTPFLDGPGQVIRNILGNIDRERFDLSFLSIISRKESNAFGSILPSLRDMNIPYRCLRLRKPLDLFAPVLIGRVLREWKPDIVHTHLLRGNVYGRLAARMAGIRTVVSTVHSRRQWMDSHWFLEWAAGWLDRVTVPLATEVVAVAEDTRAALLKLKGYAKCSISVIRNGIDIDRFYPSESRRAVARQQLGVDRDCFVVGFVGRIDRAKNPLLIVDALRRVRDDHRHVLLAVVGTGRMEAEMMGLARELGLADHVRFLGARRDVPVLLCGFDAFLLPSAWEGQPVALCEAMATGVPCVATPVGDVPALIRHEVTGLLVGPDAGEIASALLRLARDPLMRSALGLEGRETICRECSAQELGRKYQAVYEKLATRK